MSREPASWTPLISGLCGLVVLMGAQNAWAFCRTTTCDPATECRYNSRGCATEGLPLEWSGGCVSFSVQRDGSPKRGISYDKAHSITQHAFDKWTNADCGSGIPSLTASDRSPVSCSDPEYNSDAPNANVVMFRDSDWPYSGASATLALTTITFNYETGEIFDADIEINSHRTPLTTSNVAVEFDLESIITHETGHFLGLSHSDKKEATMYLEYGEGDISLRDLDVDDISGICAIYPPNRKVSDQSCTPRHGFSSDCKAPADSGCSITRPGSVPVGGWALLGLGAATLSGRLLRRRRRSATRA